MGGSESRSVGVLEMLGEGVAIIAVEAARLGVTVGSGESRPDSKKNAATPPAISKTAMATKQANIFPFLNSSFSSLLSSVFWFARWFSCCCGKPLVADLLDLGFLISS